MTISAVNSHKTSNDFQNITVNTTNDVYVIHLDLYKTWSISTHSRTDWIFELDDIQSTTENAENIRSSKQTSKFSLNFPSQNSSDFLEGFGRETSRLHSQRSLQLSSKWWGSTELAQFWRHRVISRLTDHFNKIPQNVQRHLSYLFGRPGHTKNLSE